MKGHRRNWSINGGENLALLLSLYHTVGFEGLFEDLIPLSSVNTEKTERILSSRENPETIGRGYEYYNTGSLAVKNSFLNNAIQQIEISNLKFI